MEIESKIKDLALVDALTGAQLLVEDLKKLRDGLVTRSQIFDDQILTLRREREALAEERRKWREELIQFRADRQICGRLNVLADHKPTIVNTPNNTGEINETDFTSRFTK